MDNRNISITKGPQSVVFNDNKFRKIVKTRVMNKNNKEFLLVSESLCNGYSDKPCVIALVSGDYYESDTVIPIGSTENITFRILSTSFEEIQLQEPVYVNFIFQVFKN